MKIRMKGINIFISSTYNQIESSSILKNLSFHDKNIDLEIKRLLSIAFFCEERKKIKESRFDFTGLIKLLDIMKVMNKHFTSKVF